MKKMYAGVKSYGENLWEAIIYTSYGASDPPLVSDWIDHQTNEYMTEEWDYESIRDYMDDLPNSELDLFFDVLVEHDIDIDDCFLGNINRNDLQKWSEGYSKTKPPVMALTNFDKLKDDYELKIKKKEFV